MSDGSTKVPDDLDATVQAFVAQAGAVAPPVPCEQEGTALPPLANHVDVPVPSTVDGEEVVKIVVEPRSPASILERLRNFTVGWPKVAAGQLFVEGLGLRTRALADATQFFAWLDAHFAVNWKKGSRLITEARFAGCTTCIPPSRRPPAQPWRASWPSSPRRPTWTPGSCWPSLGQPAACQTLILERQGAIDDDEHDRDLVVCYFGAMVMKVLGREPSTASPATLRAFIPSTLAARRLGDVAHADHPPH